MPEPKLTVRRVPIESLRPDPENVRLHSDRNLAAIKASLSAFGQQKPIVVRADGTVVAGNGTMEAAKALGWTEIDVVETALEGSALRAFAIADNRTAELAEWDAVALARALAELEDPRSTGFSAAEVAEFGSVMADGDAGWQAATAKVAVSAADTVCTMTLHLSPAQRDSVLAAIEKMRAAAGQGGEAQPRGGGQWIAAICARYLAEADE